MDTYYGIFISKQEALSISSQTYYYNYDILDNLQENLKGGNDIVIFYNEEDDTYCFCVLLFCNQKIVKHIQEHIPETIINTLDKFLVLNNLTSLKGREVVFTLFDID